MNFGDIDTIVIDFYQTLSSDAYFKTLEPDQRAQISELLFLDGYHEIADLWWGGLATSWEICDYLSDHLKLPTRDIHGNLVRGCSDMEFNEAVLRFAVEGKRAGYRMALVTVNSDIFTEVVAPAHNLHDIFDVIVSSSDRQELFETKQPMWDSAFEAIGNSRGYETSFLVEDTLEIVEHFRELGGTAHHYQGDVSFEQWLISKSGFITS